MKFKQFFLTCYMEIHGGVQRSSPVLRDPRGKFLCRIKPLCEIPEKEIVLYASEWI